MGTFILVIFFLIGLFIAIQRLTARPSVREMKTRIREHEDAIKHYQELIKKAYYERQQRDADNGQTF